MYQYLDNVDAMDDYGNQSVHTHGRASLTEEEFISDKYKMNYANRGLAVIINNSIFKKETHLPIRSGSDRDEEKMYYLLNTLGFEQILRKKDRTCAQMEADLKEVANKDHSTNSCFACIILSYGEEGYVYGTDNKISLESLLNPFKGNNCTTLSGKPKIFLIQACSVRSSFFREQSDSGVMEEEFEEEAVKIPSEADFLVVYSDVPGLYGWQDDENSWFIYSICEAFEAYWSKKDVLTIMTSVLGEMEKKFKHSKSNNNRDFQIPCITSMLTKSLYFE